jgi:hypothetical protein
MKSNKAHWGGMELLFISLSDVLVAVDLFIFINTLPFHDRRNNQNRCLTRTIAHFLKAR